MKPTIDNSESQTPWAAGVPLNASGVSYPTGAPIFSAPKNHLSVSKPEHNSSGSVNHLSVSKPEHVLPDAVNIVQPGEYHPGYIDQMIAYFDRPKAREIVNTYTWKSGAVEEVKKYVPNTPPHFSEFARKIGVSGKTLKSWAKKYPEFKMAYDQCQEILEEFLIDNGLTGAYGAIAMKFVAVNRTSMKDKTEQTTNAFNINKFLDDLASGKIRAGDQSSSADLIENNDDEF